MRDKNAERLRWLRQAEHDLAFGRLALRERYFAQACFSEDHRPNAASKVLASRAEDRLRW